MISDWPIGGSDHGATEAALPRLKVLQIGAETPPGLSTNPFDAAYDKDLHIISKIQAQM